MLINGPLEVSISNSWNLIETVSMFVVNTTIEHEYHRNPRLWHFKQESISSGTVNWTDYFRMHRILIKPVMLLWKPQYCLNPTAPQPPQPIYMSKGFNTCDGPMYDTRIVYLRSYPMVTHCGVWKSLIDDKNNLAEFCSKYLPVSAWRTSCERKPKLWCVLKQLLAKTRDDVKA